MKAWQGHPRIASWLAEPVPANVEASLIRLADADHVQYVAVMPDVHLADDVCIGTVVATRKFLYPQAVGCDIGCGMTAMRYDADADLLADEKIAGRLMAYLYRHVPSNRHSAGAWPSMPVALRETPLSHERLESIKRRDGKVQLGTLGRGNHFLEMQVDDQGRLWIMLHSGSRGIGHAISQHHLRDAPRTHGGLAYLEADDLSGEAYLHDVDWAVRYAETNRLTMLRLVSAFLQEAYGINGVADSLIDHHHNHVRNEAHFEQHYWVHRKGAQSARQGEPGILPGSMGTCSYLITGRGCAAALQSSAHGAGRRLSRSQARAQVTRRQLERQMGHVWFDRRRTQQLRDEAPNAYKDIDAVLRAQRPLAKVACRLRPLLSYKGV